MSVWAWRAVERRVEVAREGRIPEAWEVMKVCEGPTGSLPDCRREAGPRVLDVGLQPQQKSQ